MAIMSRKSKEFSKLLQDKKTKQVIKNNIYQKMEQRVNQGPLGKEKEVTLVRDLPGEEKMSEVLHAFCAPYITDSTTPTEDRFMVSIAVMAWNLALIDEEAQRQAMTNSLIEKVETSVQPEAILILRELVEELIARKKQHFNHINRFIVEYEMQQTKTGFDLFVASTRSTP
ncbi:MAG: hypothetical protein HC890_07255 [Chloroflexaceae bacterium]|nr:hypothetical protein [Chloroflexaceae bacterium]